MRNIWKDGIFGVVTGDALGCPVQFDSRAQVAANPVTGMRGYGSFMLPPGSWTDDSSLTLALLDSICETGCLDLCDIMDRFADWLENGAFTPYNKPFDIGGGTRDAVKAYERSRDPHTCGGRDEWNNGNGSLMRILPACLYCSEKGYDDAEAVEQIHAVGGLTHAHIRANIACGLYYFMVREILNGEGGLTGRMQKGLDAGFALYGQTLSDMDELNRYFRLRDLGQFARTPAEKIKSGGYVVDTLEAAVWSLITTDSFEEALLKAVNLGDDTDTVGAIAGGLAGLYYGYGTIPAGWIREIKKAEWIESLCEKAEALRIGSGGGK